MTVWRAVAEALKAEGVPHIFGLPGNPLHLLDDVDRHTDIKIVLVRHEHTGVACAYAYARLTGRPAVCFGNPGPGITNMVTGLRANRRGVPVLIDCRIPKHDYPPHFTRYHPEVWGLGAKGGRK